MTGQTRAWLFFAALVALPQSLPVAQASAVPAWPDTYVGRLQVLALMQTINAQILASRSSTLTLEEWCREHRLAEEPKIVASLDTGATQPASPEQRQRLQVSGADEVKYRHVRLRCGTRTLAEADNWYVAGRLTPEMNRLLDTTDTPFGTAVRPLEPYRQTLSVTMIWSPLAAGWERGGQPPAGKRHAMQVIPETLFEHRALLYTREHTPFSEVRESYRRDLLAFPSPQ